MLEVLIMAFEPKQAISMELLDLIDWISTENNTEYEKGILTGLRMAECLAEAVERNSEVADSGE